MLDASYWIARLALQPHPEGGWFNETHRSIETIPGSALPERYGGDRRMSTAIYFLLTGERPSKLHRLKSEEIWHFYAGGAVTLHILTPDGRHTHVTLGSDPINGEVFQGIVHAGWWFGAEVHDPSGYALVGCTVAPGFDFADFEMGNREALLEQYPRHRELVERLT